MAKRKGEVSFSDAAAFLHMEELQLRRDIDKNGTTNGVYTSQLEIRKDGSGRVWVSIPGLRAAFRILYAD